MWLSSGLVMGYLVVEFEVVVKAKKRCYGLWAASLDLLAGAGALTRLAAPLVGWPRPCL